MLEELVVGLVDLLTLRDEYLLHDLLDHVVFLAKVGMLALHLSLQLLIRYLHLIDLLLQLDLLLIEPFLVRVLHALRDVGPRVLVLFGLLVREIRHALQVLRWLQLISGCRLRPRPPPLPKRRFHQRGLLHNTVGIARVSLSADLAVRDRSLRSLTQQVVEHRHRLLIRIRNIVKLVQLFVSLLRLLVREEAPRLPCNSG